VRKKRGRFSILKLQHNRKRIEIKGQSTGYIILIIRSYRRCYCLKPVWNDLLLFCIPALRFVIIGPRALIIKQFIIRVLLFVFSTMSCLNICHHDWEDSLEKLPGARKYEIDLDKKHCEKEQVLFASLGTQRTPIWNFFAIAFAYRSSSAINLYCFCRFSFYAL